jgi:hypothetical protein
MRFLKYIILLFLLTLLSCDKSSSNPPKGDVQTTVTTDQSSSNALKSETQSDSTIKESAIRPVNKGRTPTRSKRGIRRKPNEENSDKKFKMGRKLTPTKLNLQQENKINRTIHDSSILDNDPDLQIETAVQAFERLNVNLSMAAPPQLYAEDESYYYFSGGTSANPIDDFSSGIRVSKSGGKIYIWSDQDSNRNNKKRK